MKALRDHLPAVGPLVAALWALTRVDRSWVPHDEGMLGQAATRILAGELPHRDFDAAYTGGLEYLHAGVMALLGVDLLWLRLVLFVAFATWLVVLWRVASRWLDPWATSGIVTLAALLTLPQWPAPLPTWYCLFLGTGALACMLRHEATRRTRWLGCAGLLAGISILFKIVGLYTLAAVLLYVAAAASRELEADAPPAGTGGPVAGAVLVSAGALALTAMVALLVRTQWSAAAALVFVAPVAAAVAAVAWDAWRCRPSVAALVRLAAPATLAAALPVALFAAFFAAQGGLADLTHGALVLPRVRFRMAAEPLPGLGTLLGGVAIGIPLIAAAASSRRRQFVLGTGVALVVTGGVMVAGGGATARFAVQALRSWAVLGAVWGAWRLARPSRNRSEAPALAALVGTAALWGLVQFPFAAEYYVFYAVPPTLLLLAVLAVSPGGRRPGPAALVYLGVVAVYAVVNSHHTVGGGTTRLEGMRASLRVPPGDAAAYGELVRTVRALDPGASLFATPDAAEVAYLAGLGDANRSLYDFLDEPEGRTGRVMEALAREKVRVVVLKERGQFSGPVPPDLRDALQARYPVAVHIDRFEVRTTAGRLRRR